MHLRLVDSQSNCPSAGSITPPEVSDEGTHPRFEQFNCHITSGFFDALGGGAVTRTENVDTCTGNGLTEDLSSSNLGAACNVDDPPGTSRKSLSNDPEAGGSQSSMEYIQEIAIAVTRI